MKPSEAALVLTVAARIDKRIIGTDDAHAWADALANLDVNDCIQAVAIHRQRSDEYLLPIHVRRIARELLTTRLDKAACERGLPTGPLAGEATRAEVRALTAKAVADARLARTKATTTEGDAT
jgi:hypothetical protein